MAEHDDTLARVVETLKEPVRIDPSLGARVMAEIERVPAPAQEPSGAGSVFEWLRRPRTIRLSPLGGLAMAAGLAAVVLVGSQLSGPREGVAPSVRTDAVEQTSLVQFVLVAPEAGSVTVVGDFNDWNSSATPLVQEEGNGVWWVTVPIPPGRYRYSFLVDGTVWVSDPNAPKATDDFGRPNSVVTIGGA